ncbi:alpha/beta hydrolase [Sphingomonas sp. ASV193]|uniref:alpha/beta fold hydrolase n=1 Tax=Sphingomonas sp. ASV193 TaxID=3144405 RepID=UPI0032E90D81
MTKSKSPARQDRFWNSAEGLRLHYRDYAGPADQPPLLCIPGLTRNARDFEGVAERLAGDWRVICVDLRGRGMSEYDPDPRRYALPAYVADLMKLLDQLGIAEAVFVGTSLGGLITMAVAAGGDEERIAGALLNDIGPDIDRDGLEFIAQYVGKERHYPDWASATRAVAEAQESRFPGFGEDDWARFTRRTFAERDGAVRPDYDLKIADNFAVALDAPPVDAWPYYRALAGRPVTLLRGTLSDLFSTATAERMVREIPDVELVEVPNVGHAPTLDEPESIAALDRLLTRVRESSSPVS